MKDVKADETDVKTDENVTSKTENVDMFDGVHGFEKDKDGNVVFNPKIDTSKLPDISKVLQANCELLNMN